MQKKRREKMGKIKSKYSDIYNRERKKQTVESKYSTTKTHTERSSKETYTDRDRLQNEEID